MYPHHLHNQKRPTVREAVAPRGYQLVEIILLYAELKHDIETDIHRLERMRKMMDTPILSPDGSDDYTLAREIDNAINKAVSLMTAYMVLPSPFVRRISTNHAHSWEEKNIFVALPGNWPMHNIDPLRDAVHGFAVKSVEVALLAVALPDDSYTAICQQQAYTQYNAINSLISARLGAIEIHPTPFG